MLVASAAIAVLLLWPDLEQWRLPRPLAEVIGVVAMLLVALPFLLWDAKRPLAFEVEVDGQFARFTFRNSEYAQRFRLFNLGALPFRVPAEGGPTP